jgi:metal iron transporter
MNCPSRTDDTLAHPGWNQNPPPFSADTTTRNDFNGLANSRVHRRHAANADIADDPISVNDRPLSQHRDPEKKEVTSGEVTAADPGGGSPPRSSGSPRLPFSDYVKSSSLHCARTLAKFGRFIGPGFLIAVAYIDPGNYATDVAAGAEFKYRLLFIVLVSNLFAILLQSLCIKLGSVTGLNLAENCREHLPKWLNIFLYVLAEAAIVATDIAEVGVSFSGLVPLIVILTI